MNKLFIINKERGPTSFDVVDAFRKASRIRKVGHTGTLDPLAEGVLLLCTGKATRAAEHFVNLPKTYEFEVRLGAETDTLDAGGEVIRRGAVPDLSDEVAEYLRLVVGENQAVPRGDRSNARRETVELRTRILPTGQPETRIELRVTLVRREGVPRCASDVVRVEIEVRDQLLHATVHRRSAV